MALPDEVSLPATGLPGQPLLPDHFDYLAGSGISEAYLRATPLIRSVETQSDLPDYFREREDIVRPRGILFGWRTKDGSIEWQLRLDEPLTDPETGRVKKYLMRADSGIRYGLILKRSGSKVLIVEGTKQGHAVAAAIDMNTTVIQIPGCTGWSRDGWQAPMELVQLTSNKQTYILLDADAADNPLVYTAGEKLASRLAPTARAVKFLQCPGEGKSGIDDFLSGQDERQRKTTLEVLVKNAKTRPATHRPKPALRVIDGDGNPNGDNSEWMFSPGGKLRVDTVAKHLLTTETPVALGASGLAVYGRGVYTVSDAAIEAMVGDLLLDQYDTGKVSNLSSRLRGLCHSRGLVLRDARTFLGESPLFDEPLLCVENGVVNLESGELLPHSPDYLMTTRFAVKYDPSATCPTFDSWLSESTKIKGRDQVDVLLDVTSQILDFTRLPEKSPFLFGPTRSGKSTFLELLVKLVGPGATSGMKMQDLESDQFAIADLYGKRINVDADVSDEYVPSVSNLKRLTGRDPITANLKYGKRFTFINQALPVFSGNTLPTVGERSRAFMARVVPVSFPHSKEGHEDESLPGRLEDELPGILNRLIEAWRARRARGKFLPPRRIVLTDFEQRVSSVHAFLADACWLWAPGGEGWVPPRKGGDPKRVRAGYGLSLKKLYKLYEAWAAATGHRGKLLQGSFKKQILDIPGVVVGTCQIANAPVFNVTPNLQAEWGDVPVEFRFAVVPKQPPPALDEDDDEGGDADPRGGSVPPLPPAPTPAPPAPSAPAPKSRERAVTKKSAPSVKPTVTRENGYMIIRTSGGSTKPAPTAVFESAREELLHAVGPEAKFRYPFLDSLTERAEAEARAQGGEPAVEELRAEVARLRAELEDRITQARMTMWGVPSRSDYRKGRDTQ
ncbi:phage/plasmid primase, P4 family, C-terminal domain [Mycobacteroides abscessus subsp. abscessus]|uniref:DNA primase family protein n=1 Tax=Mycobacteroides abscessus TaxID=36809 RepID=UPI00092C1D9C|nr:phage/plasmid primase, P4 family [Mycobacteroides abscessus]SIG37716.1 phage/plasmid primase, P4 family, C-terminal domain [Mycobacteroides abscessus subsp. abscessus]SLI42609.1 phage/plasmid primase [Mycobacteroides abscessus subsp. abscessus]